MEKQANSFAHMWSLLSPDDQYRDLYYPCMRVWNKLSHRRQQQMTHVRPLQWLEVPNTQTIYRLMQA